MTDPEPPIPRTVGDRLRQAREAQGLDLADVAARTRIPARSLQAIENGDYVVLKAPTYAIGFARAYARVVGVDEVAVARDVRGAVAGSFVRHREEPVYNTGDLSRVPPRGVMVASVVAGIAVLIAAALWFGTALFRHESSAPAASSTAISVPPPAAAPATAPATGGQVTLTAADEVWLRVYDASGKTLFQGTMKSGDHYDVPGDADRPMINVGRPDKLQVTVNGSAVPPLGDGRVAIKDVAVGSAALLARPTGGVAAPAGNSD